jgi:hypothetical protein
MNPAEALLTFCVCIYLWRCHRLHHLSEHNIDVWERPQRVLTATKLAVTVTAGCVTTALASTVTKVPVNDSRRIKISVMAVIKSI